MPCRIGCVSAHDARAASSSIRPRASSRTGQLSRAVMIFILIMFMSPPASFALPSIFFNLESIDIQPLDEGGSRLRVCAEFHASNVTLGRGVAAAKLKFSPDGPSAIAHATGDAVCVDGVERGGRYRASIVLIDDRDGSELPVQPPPPGVSSQFWKFSFVVTS